MVHARAMPRTRLPAAALLCSSALVLGSCGDAERDDAGDAGSDGDGGITVVASFYPLEYAVERVAGDHVETVTLTDPGVDPHDLEMSPEDVATVQGADVVLYSSGLQAAVDDAVGAQAGDSAFDVNEAADLVETGSEDEHADEEEGHSEDEEGHDDHGGVDPHFWLDPQRYAGVAEAIAEELAEADPDNAEDYRANAADFVAELEELDEEFATGLAECEQTSMVTTHAAFGYISTKHGLEQVGITGLSPEAEPSPARMAEVTEIVEDNGVDTIYSEVLLGAELADTIANETGAEVLLLDPIEGITDESAGEDYLEVMRANLETLRSGQGCR
ncbi:zinc ABC transporter substrate-binding protein [soil metagenome]